MAWVLLPPVRHLTGVCGVALTLVLAGCATAPAPVAQCSGTNWYQTGVKDGLEGKSGLSLGRHQEQCPGVDILAYQNGRAEGLRMYCLPESGYRIGKAGREYLGVCPEVYAEAFLREYERGRREWRRPEIGLSLGVGSRGRVGWGVGIGLPIGYGRYYR